MLSNVDSFQIFIVTLEPITRGTGFFCGRALTITNPKLA